MMILNVAFERRTSATKRWNWRLPSIVRPGSLMRSLHACDTGWRNDGTISENVARLAGGAVGARSGALVSGLLQVPPALALASRNERSSSMKNSALRPQRNRRYRPLVAEYVTGE